MLHDVTCYNYRTKLVWAYFSRLSLGNPVLVKHSIDPFDMFARCSCEERNTCVTNLTFRGERKVGKQKGNIFSFGKMIPFWEKWNIFRYDVTNTCKTHALYDIHGNENARNLSAIRNKKKTIYNCRPNFGLKWRHKM